MPLPNLQAEANKVTAEVMNAHSTFVPPAAAAPPLSPGLRRQSQNMATPSDTS